MQISYPLVRDFRFIHEPLGTTPAGTFRRFVGRRSELSELASRILLSEGGAFLVTGYRGVGKTSFVNLVIEEIWRQVPDFVSLTGQIDIVDVHLNLARPMKATDLMFHILRGLYDRLSEKGLLARIGEDTREELELAFTRTSFSVGYKTSDQTERSFGLGDLAFPYVYGLKPKFSFHARSARSRARELSFLAYDDKSAEHDLIRLSRRLAAGYAPDSSLLRRLAGLFSRKPSEGIRLKMVFIFDELDKLDQERDPQARSALDDIIGNLKTLFTTSGISFIFVAGKDLYERWMEDVGRGDSIYESVFTYAKYLPALWNSVEDFCDPLLDPEMTGGQTADPKEYLAFKKFLAFKGRGIPRMIQRGFNEYVRWSDTRAWLTFSPEGARRFRFYAGLYDVLHDNEEQLFGNVRDAELPVASDQRRLAMHYLIDWVLQRGLTDFSLEDSILASRRLSRVIAPSETVAPEIINALLRILVAHEYIEEIPAANLSQVQIINQGALPSPRYRLLRRRLVEMGSISDIFDQEAQTILAEKKSPTIPSDRYQIVKEIAHGGMGAVYQAFDTRTGRIVAIKQVRADLGSAYRERFRREAEILARFRHPGIVRVLDMDLAGEHCYLVMEFVEGARLSDLITQKALGAAEILIIARELLEVVEYIHSQGVIWRDLKPSNIIVTPEGELRVLDFGVARLAEVMADLEITVVGTQIGTPSYMSPEQIGTGVVDARADLYSVGVLLYQMVTGRLPFQGEKITDLIRKVLSETPPLPSGCAEVPPGLEPIIVKCLEKDPAKRFQSAREILEALPKPEGPANLRPRYTIGRSPDNDVVLNEPGLSRYHAELVESGAGYAVQDLNTVNGTFVNGTRVEYPTGLSDSDEIRIGGSVLLYLSP